MGITIIQKSDLSLPKKNPKTALVLAGGAISGGAFKLGGLMALDSFMVNQRITSFDMYVGTSAGSILSVYLANGIPPNEIVKSLEGRSGMLGPIRASEFYYLNYRDFFSKPAGMCYDICKLIPKSICNFILANNIFQNDFRHLLKKLLKNPNYVNCESFIKYCISQYNSGEKTPSIPWGYIPAGLFSTSKFEQSTRKNIESNQLYNDFNKLYEETGKTLYVVTTNLDTSERAIFGHDEIGHISISKAMEASIAIPLFYKPISIDGVDYVDGAVAKTTSMDWAIEKGADLVICYNPFRPFNHDAFCRSCENAEGRLRISEDGIYAVLNQIMRIILHTRLMSGLELRRKNPDFKGDIILIEPSEYDDKFFDMNPLAFWERRKASKRGFESVKSSISENYDVLTRILNAYGIDTCPTFYSEHPDEPVPLINTFYENIFV